ncbi:hypothetical protein V8G54_010820, partial [Vigna mungo]
YEILLLLFFILPRSNHHLLFLSFFSSFRNCLDLADVPLQFINSYVCAKKTGDVTELQIGVKLLCILLMRCLFLQHKPAKCEVQAHKGDKVKVHYRGKLTDGTVFDSSFERKNPIEFELGAGQVIKGWDQGLLGMCLGEKRKLKIPSRLGYGDQGSQPSIPGGATLIFDTELVGVNGVSLDEEDKTGSEL